MTPDKRSGGFALGTISAAQMAGGGNIAITGLGFRPKTVLFFPHSATSTSHSQTSLGIMTANKQFVSAAYADASKYVSDSSDSLCLGTVSATGGWYSSAEFTSFDSDGFTVAVINNGSSPFVYTAMA